MGCVAQQAERPACVGDTQRRLIRRRKTCSECQHVMDKMPLSVREWTCPECGAKHDRDTNAARNILMFSTAGEAGINARGAGKNLPDCVSGTRDETRTEPEKFIEAACLERAA